MPANTHLALVNLGKLLGYISREDNYGICAGVTCLWINACLTNNEAQFNQRIEAIQSNHSIQFEINAVKEKVKTHGTLTNDDIGLLEILGFYENLVLFQSPRRYQQLFNKRLNQQNILEIASIASSKSIEEQEGLSILYSEAGIYTVDEIAGYLQSLATSVQSAGVHSSNIAFILGNYNHTMGLIYNVEKEEWMLLDINNWPAKKFTNSPNDTLLLAKAIHTHFHTQPESMVSRWVSSFIKRIRDTFYAQRENPADEYIAFNIQAVTTKKNPHLHQLTSVLTQFKSNRIITKDIAARKESITLASLGSTAARNGDTSIIRSLAALGINLNQTMFDGATLMLTAAEYNHGDVIEILVSYGANPDIPDKNGFTPLDMVAQEGCTDSLKALIKCGATLSSTPGFLRSSVVGTAAENNNADIIEILALNGANVDDAGSYATPA